MNSTWKPAVWPQRTIDRAISLWTLIQITRAAREVELRSPSKRCPECGELVGVVVIGGVGQERGDSVSQGAVVRVEIRLSEEVISEIRAAADREGKIEREFVVNG